MPGGPQTPRPTPGNTQQENGRDHCRLHPEQIVGAVAENREATREEREGDSQLGWATTFTA